MTCVLRIIGIEDRLKIAPIEFVAPLRHAQKSYSVLGFPEPDPQGKNASGLLQAADAKGMIEWNVRAISGLRADSAERPSGHPTSEVSSAWW
jgi:hypothetical protein